jgi:hypothetical protein
MSKPKKTKICLMTEKQKKELFYNIINVLISGAISFFSALLAVGNLTLKVFGVAVITALIVSFSKFKEYWDEEKNEYSSKVFNFVKM